MHLDSNNNLIGAGEVTTKLIGSKIFPPHWTIHTQVPISKLIKKEDFDLLDEENTKGPIDLAISIKEAKNGDIWVREKFIGVIRVQGPDHGSGKTGQMHHQKSQKDSIQKILLEKNKLWVVDVLFRECPNIFKEQYNWDSIIELCTMFKMAKVMM